MINLNVGVGDNDLLAAPHPTDCLNTDVTRLNNVDVVCDVAHLPFKSKAFNNVYCFHVLEHTENPAKGLSELVRVGTDTVEIEVPHHYGRRAKSQHWKKGNYSLYHVCSFGNNWFHRCLKNFRRCIKVQYTFPRDLEIHVWVYLKEKAYGNN